MFKIALIALFVAAASAYPPVAPVAVAHAPFAVAHSPLSVAHAPLATSYANTYKVSTSAYAHPVAYPAYKSYAPAAVYAPSHAPLVAPAHAPLSYGYAASPYVASPYAASPYASPYAASPYASPYGYGNGYGYAAHY